jgi:hypothetical protein
MTAAGGNGRPSNVALNALECIGFVVRGARLLLELGVDFEIVEYGMPFRGLLRIWIYLWEIYRKLRVSEISEKIEASARTGYLHLLRRKCGVLGQLNLEEY